MTGEAKRPNFSSELDRRKFIGVAAATAGAILIRPKLVRGTAANSAIRVGLLGCGGRGTEDASNLVDTGNADGDRKSTRLNSSHPSISYAVFCLKKKIDKHLAP